MISASIIQGTSLGLASYVVTASDLQPVTQGNTMVKYADDTYLVVPADNVHSCADEIIHVERRAEENNLSLNRVKSADIVFVSPWSKRAVVIPSLAVPGIERVDSIKVLGVSQLPVFSHRSRRQSASSLCANNVCYAYVEATRFAGARRTLYAPFSKLQWLPSCRTHHPPGGDSPMQQTSTDLKQFSGYPDSSNTEKSQLQH